MTLGQFHLTGKVQQVTKDGVDAGIDQDTTVATGWTAQLTSNYPKGVPVPDGNEVDYIDIRTVVLLSDGSISEDGVTAGISLTAHNPAWFATPLQWTIKPDTITLTSGKTMRPKPWTFNAPLDGEAATLGGLTPVVGIPLHPAPGATPWDSVSGRPPTLAAGPNVANGYAALDGSGQVSAANLPSYVDDVLEYANRAAFPGTGETGKIYVALDTSNTYRWSGSTYIQMSDTATLNTATGRAVAYSIALG